MIPSRLRQHFAGAEDNCRLLPFFKGEGAFTIIAEYTWIVGLLLLCTRVVWMDCGCAGVAQTTARLSTKLGRQTCYDLRHNSAFSTSAPSCSTLNRSRPHTDILTPMGMLVNLQASAPIFNDFSSFIGRAMGSAVSPRLFAQSVS